MRMKKTIRRVIALAAAVAVVLTSRAAPAFAAQVEKPDITASGAIVYCQNTGEIVYSKNREKKLAPYSVTKLMTVLLAVQNLPLDQEVTVSAKAAAQEESSMDLKEGEVLTVKDLIYGCMLPSGNDAAYALGEAVSGDMDSFVELMNKTAENIGCKNTHFSNPSGLKSSKNYTTAYDMMLITKMALSNDVICKAAGSTKYTVAKTNKHKKRTLKTHLSFLSDAESGVYAGKTGYWDDSSCTIALGYRKDGLRLFIVLLGDTADERENDVNKLIAYAKQKVEGVKVIGKDKASGKVRIKHGAKTRLETYTAEIGYAYLPKEASESLIGTKVTMDSDVKAPVKAGTVVGKLEIYAADELVNEVDLIIKEDVEAGWFPSYVGISNLATMIICGVIALLLVFFIWVSAVKAKYRRKKQRIRQRKIMEMAMAEMRKDQDYNERDWHL